MGDRCIRNAGERWIPSLKPFLCFIAPVPPSGFDEHGQPAGDDGGGCQSRQVANFANREHHHHVP